MLRPLQVFRGLDARALARIFTGGGFAATLVLHCLFLFPLRLLARTQVVDQREAPYHELRISHLLADRDVAKLAHAIDQRAQLCARRFRHSGKPKAPREDVRDQIGQLNAGRQLAVHEERLGDDLRRPPAALPGLLEIPVHLLDEKVALDALQLVEHHQARRLPVRVLEKVEVPFEQIRVVLPEKVGSRRPWGIRGDHARERLASEPGADLQRLLHVCQLRLRERSELVSARGRAIREASRGEYTPFLRVHRG
ncbi:MAG TPA: hypothetical protein VF006_18605 [Longimicrobium sp.]